MTIIKNIDNTSIVKYVDEMEPSHIAGGDMKWWSCFGKQFGSFINF